jgi:hypothetical protein
MIAIAFLIAALSAATTQLAGQPDSASVDSVISRYYVAIGGHDALLADTTILLAGSYEEGAFKATGTMLWRRAPLARRVAVAGPDGFAYVEIFDGMHEWEYSERFAKPAQLDTGAAERAGRRGAEFDESFVDYAAKGHRVESLGRTSISGRDVYQLHVVLSDGWQKDYYFDPATGLVYAMGKAMPLHARGADIESLSYFSDYRKAGHVLRPFVIEERNMKSGALMNTVRWRAIETNMPIQHSAFEVPR